LRTLPEDIFKAKRKLEESLRFLREFRECPDADFYSMIHGAQKCAKATVLLIKRHKDEYYPDKKKG
jgi:hypothetical protein